MPNSKFFIGSYAGDVCKRNENYTSCDWSTAMRTSAQIPLIHSEPLKNNGERLQTSNPYTYVKQPSSSASTYYAPVPIVAPFAVKECPPEPECLPEPECASTSNLISAAIEPSSMDSATHQDVLDVAQFRPRRRNRLVIRNLFESSLKRTNRSLSEQAQLPLNAQEVTPLTLIPKRMACGCNCLQELHVDLSASSNEAQGEYAGRYFDATEEPCEPRRRDKCFFYEKLKKYHRKGKSISDFLNDYEEENFYAIIDQ